MDQHQHIVLCYQQKNFEKCLSLIKETPQHIQETPHYKVLTAVCIVNLDQNVKLAHSLLNEVLGDENNNSYAHYAKGLAYNHQKKFKRAVQCFDSAIKFDESGSMKMAEELRKEALKLVKDDEAESDDDKSSVIQVQTSKVTTTVPSSKGLKRCHICPKVFAKTYSLTRHLRRHQKREFQCDQCEYKFIQNHDLKRHQETHNVTLKYHCSNCDLKFKTDRSLRDHTRIKHKEVQPKLEPEVRRYKCRVCKKSFRIRKMLRYHEKLHKKPQQEFSCDVCAKTLKAKPDILNHVTTHNNEKPFGCNLCKFSYSTIEHLGQHFRGIHGVGKGEI